ncbi:hypothetical protein Dsin_025441 [Dipteronia sinensis]|uniref:Uncharacterized protein n=1 Tax=Dipteronia sinensis TaxID=43782 RepID=A0AAE0DX49_9ROSI|nr:hypothetical protein Dsin_025441 [Dipteronia sinensis]
MPNHLHNIEPQEQHFDAHAGQATESVIGYVATDHRFVFQLIRAFKRETARVFPVGVELACRFVIIVLDYTLWKETDGEVEFLEDFVG